MCGEWMGWQNEKLQLDNSVSLKKTFYKQKNILKRQPNWKIQMLFKGKVGFSFFWNLLIYSMCCLNELYDHWIYFYVNSIFSEGHSNEQKKKSSTELSNQFLYKKALQRNVKYSEFWIYNKKWSKSWKK